MVVEICMHDLFQLVAKERHCFFMISFPEGMKDLLLVKRDHFNI